MKMKNISYIIVGIAVIGVIVSKATYEIQTKNLEQENQEQENQINNISKEETSQDEIEKKQDKINKNQINNINQDNKNIKVIQEKEKNSSDQKDLDNIKKYIAEGAVIQKSDYNYIIDGTVPNENAELINISINAEGRINLNDPKKYLEEYKGFLDLYYSDTAVYYTLMQQIMAGLDTDDYKQLENIKNEIKIYTSMRKTDGIKGINEAYNKKIIEMQNDLENMINSAMKSKVAKSQNEKEDYEKYVNGRSQMFINNLIILRDNCKDTLKNANVEKTF